MTLDELIDQAIALRDKYGGDVKIQLRISVCSGADYSEPATGIKIRTESIRCIEISA